jgi:hypothetical protein
VVQGVQSERGRLAPVACPAPTLLDDLAEGAAPDRLGTHLRREVAVVARGSLGRVEAAARGTPVVLLGEAPVAPLKENLKGAVLVLAQDDDTRHDVIPALAATRAAESV